MQINMEGAVDTLTKSVLGALLVFVGWAYWRKDQQLTSEKDARLADSKEQTTKVTEAFQESTRVTEMLLTKIELGKKRGEQ